jgi:toxin ParE1/3/4
LGRFEPVRIEFHPEARFELIEAGEWYRLASARDAREFWRAFNASMDLLAIFPAAGRLEGSVRIHALTAFPYQVVYREVAVGVEIIAVAHTSRRPGYWRNRLK